MLTHIWSRWFMVYMKVWRCVVLFELHCLVLALLLLREMILLSHYQNDKMSLLVNQSWLFHALVSCHNSYSSIVSTAVCMITTNECGYPLITMVTWSGLCMTVLPSGPLSSHMFICVVITPINTINISFVLSDFNISFMTN